MAPGGVGSQNQLNSILNGPGRTFIFWFCKIRTAASPHWRMAAATPPGMQANAGGMLSASGAGLPSFKTSTVTWNPAACTPNTGLPVVQSSG